MANQRKKLTERTVKAASEPGIIWDSELTGFGLRVGATAKTFFYNYRIHGRERRIKIDTYPKASAESAREKAKDYAEDVRQGIDPLARKQAADGASTVADVWANYEEEHLPDKRESSQRGDRDNWERYIKPAIGRIKAHAVETAEIRKLHRKIKARAPYQANRVLALVSKLFNWAKDEMKLPVSNPAKGVKKAPEEKRKRYLNPEELQRLARVLEEYPNMARHKLPKSEWKHEDGKLVKSRLVRLKRPDPERMQSANIIRLIMLTGCRKGEALAAKWEQFDLEAGRWTKPAATTKQDQEHVAPLSSAAVELLKGIDQQGEYLFPGEDGHQKGIKSAWETIRKRADIEDVRIHDLRHTYASVLASAGQSLPVIGALLGHTQSKTTERYAHLFDDPLRKATEAAGAVLSGKPKAEVTNIKEGRK